MITETTEKIGACHYCEKPAEYLYLKHTSIIISAVKYRFLCNECRLIKEKAKNMR